jgi:trehalose 6-phosphate phosphatase
MRESMRLNEPPAALLRDASLFLDFDGTLVELAPSPDAVRVEDDLRDLLTRLQAKLDGRLALLSGRAVADVRGHLHPVTLAMSGSHGLELAPVEGDIIAGERPAGLAQAIEEFRKLESRYPGVLVEEKPMSVALHFRSAPHAEPVCHAAAEQAARDTGMTLQLGKMLVELKPATGHKGSALLQFMAQPPFAGTTPVFVGDDLTDEHGFDAARELGGAGVLVGPERSTAAMYRLENVGAVRNWLQTASELLP